MPATPAHQDPLQDSWRVEELTPDLRRTLRRAEPRRVGESGAEGPGRRWRPPHTERPRSRG